MAFNYGLAKQDGFSDEQIAQHLSQKQKFNLDLALTDGFNYSQIAQHLATQGEAEDTGFLREALDVPVLVGKGATQMVRMGTEAFGADNPVAQSLMGIEDYLGSLISAGSRNQQEEIAQIFEDAEGKGVKENVMAGLKALTVAPVDTLAQFGGSAIPFVAANVLTGGAASAPLALGATAGLGLTKGTIFDSVEQEYIQAGVDPETAKEIATEAQAYMGENIDQIALGGALGAVAARFGLERGLTQLVTGNVAKSVALPTGMRAIVGGALAESIPEAVQAGQEQFASNLARERQGFDVDLMEGVVGQSVFEGGAGLILGGGTGTFTGRQNRRINDAEQAAVTKRENEQEEQETQRIDEEIARQVAAGDVLADDFDLEGLDDYTGAADLTVEPAPPPPEPLPARDLDVTEIQTESQQIIRQVDPDQELTFISEPIADGSGYQVKGSDGRSYGAPVTEAEPARQLAFRLNQTKRDQQAVKQANDSINSSGLATKDTPTLRSYLAIGNRVLNPRYNEVTYAEINAAADATTDESILTDPRREAIRSLPLEQAEYYLTKGSPANRAKSKAEMLRLFTPVQRENYKRKEKGLSEKSTFSMAEARKVLGKNFGNLADPQTITPEIEFQASMAGTSVPLSRREIGSPKKKKTLLRQGVYRAAEGAPKEVTLDTLNDLLEQKNISSSIKSKEMKPLIKAFTGVGSYQSMTEGDRRVLYKSLNRFSDFAQPSKLPLFETVQVTADDDIVTPDTGDIESETSKQRAEFIQDFRRKQAARPYPESEAARRESAYIRRSYGRESGPYERRISRDDGRDGLLELESALNSATYQDTGLSLPQVFEVDARLEADNYYNDMVAAMSNHKFAAQVEIKPPAELSKYRLFRTPNGSGFAIKPDGDIVAVFAGDSEPKGGSYALLQAAVQAGGKKLDAFNTYLPKIYSRVGFRPVARLPWNDEFAPSNWDKQTFQKFSNGEPEIYFFTYDPFYYGESTNVPLAQDYDDAVRLQDEALEPRLALPSPEIKTTAEPRRENAVAADESKATPDPGMSESQAQQEVQDSINATLKLLRGEGVSKGVQNVVANQGGGAAGSNAVSGITKPSDPNSWNPLKKSFDNFIFNIQDKFIGLKRIEQGISKGANKDSLHTLESAYDGLESITGIVGNEFNKIENEEIVPLLEKLNDLNITRKEFNDFLILRHAIERNAQIRQINQKLKGTKNYRPELDQFGAGQLEGNNLTDNYVKQRMASDFGLTWDAGSKSWAGGNSLGNDMSAVAADFDKFTRKTLKFSLDSGLISQKQYDDLLSKYKYYAPLKGRSDDSSIPLTQDEEGLVDENARSGLPSAVNNYSVKGAEGKQAKGRTSEAFDPLANAYAARQSTVARGVKNKKLGERLYELIKNHPNDKVWMIKQDADVSRKQFSGQTLPTSIGFKREGKQIEFVIKNKRLREALLGMDVNQANAIVHMLRGLNRFLSAANTSYNPEFIFSNFSRDVQTALANLVGEQNMKGGKAKDVRGWFKLNVVKDVLPSVGQVYKGFRKGNLSPEIQAEWDAYLESGAKTDFFYARSPQETAQQMGVLDEMARGTYKGNARKAWNATTGFVSDINGAVENGVRFATFKAARKQFLANDDSVEAANAKAATLAKNLTVNFNRKGNMSETANALYLFFNASVQGSANFVRGLSSGRKQSMLLAMTTLGYLLTQLNEDASDEDPKTGRSYYDGIPDYEKERNFIIMKTIFNPDADPEDAWKIPLPYGYNVLHLLGLNFYEIQNGQKSIEDASVDLLSAAVGSFAPIGFSQSEDALTVAGKAIAPQFAKPVIEMMVNENHFGSPIYREEFPFATPLPDSAKSMNSTPEWMKNSAEFLNAMTLGPFEGGNPREAGPIDISPNTINHLLDSFTGGAGMFAVRSAEYARKLRDGEEIEDREVPFRRRVMTESNNRESQSDFYDRKDIINQKTDRIDDLRGSERFSYRQDNIPFLRMNGILESTEKRIRGINARLTTVRDRLMEETNIARRLQLLEQEESLQELKDGAYGRFNRRYDETVGRTE